MIKASFKLVFNINAGKKYFFNELTLNLPEDYDEKDFKDIKKIFKKLKGKKYSLNSVEEILEEIDKIASLKLYDFIDASVKENIVDQIKLILYLILKIAKNTMLKKLIFLEIFKLLKKL